MAKGKKTPAKANKLAKKTLTSTPVESAGPAEPVQETAPVTLQPIVVHVLT